MRSPVFLLALLGFCATSAQPQPRPEPFILYRTVGNDLPPRHAIGQTRSVVEFILQNEPRHPGCERRWLVNRIFDAQEEQRIIQLLDQYEETYVRVPFDINEYATLTTLHDRCHLFWQCERPADPATLRKLVDVYHSPRFWEQWWDPSVAKSRQFLEAMYRDKNNYLMHNNGARNQMLALGIEYGADWILPWDGTCFLTPAAFEQIKAAVKLHGAESKYFYTAFYRVAREAEEVAAALRSGGDAALLQDVTAGEPQLMFRRDARERFDERMPYGRLPKVEMLWRLGVAGVWDRWDLREFDALRAKPARAADAPAVVPQAGYVLRLALATAEQGAMEHEASDVTALRRTSRLVGIQTAVLSADIAVASRLHGYHTGHLALYDWAALTQVQAQWRAGTAAPVVASEMTGLTRCAEGGGVSGAPHPGLPAESGAAAAAAAHVTCAALAGLLTSEKRHLDAAAGGVAALLLDRYPAESAAVGRDLLLRGTALPALLDAVRIVAGAGGLDAQRYRAAQQRVAGWVAGVQSSAEGADAFLAVGRRGVEYDLSMAAAAAFSENMETFFNHTEFAKGRLMREIVHGDQQERLDVAWAWVQLASVSEKAGIDIWRYAGSEPEPALLTLCRGVLTSSQGGQNRALPPNRLLAVLWSCSQRYREIQAGAWGEQALTVAAASSSTAPLPPLWQAFTPVPPPALY